MAYAGDSTELVNLYHEMETKMDKQFEVSSYTESMVGKDWNWDGVNSISIPTTSHFQLYDYDLTQPWYVRTGPAQEIYDQLNTYTLRGARTFHGLLDEVPSMDQKFIRKMATAMKETVDDELVPENDHYRLNVWCNGAGNVMFGTSDSLKAKKSSADEDIVRTFLRMNAKLNNMHVPSDRTFVIGMTDAIETRLSERLQYNQSYTGKMIKGKIGTLGDAVIKEVPDDYLPAGVKIMVKWHNATADPRKCHNLRTIDKVVGSFATHAEGLFRYDAFVKAQKADGILLYGEGTTTTPNTGICDAPVITYDTTNGLKIQAPASPVGYASTGYTIKYIVTETNMFYNPKVHADAEVYSAAIAASNFTTGKTYKVTAFAYATGKVASGISRFTFTA